MEKRRATSSKQTSLSKTNSNSEKKICNRSKNKNEKRNPINNTNMKRKVKKKESASKKLKYDFSDNSSEDRCSLNEQSISNMKELDLKWQGKAVHLKEMKVNIKRVHNQQENATNDSLQSSDFYSCSSTTPNKPKEDITRNKLEPDNEVENILSCDQTEKSFISPTYGNSPFLLEDNILHAVQDKNGGKIMSEESEAFFWDWILKQDSM